MDNNDMHNVSKQELIKGLNLMRNSTESLRWQNEKLSKIEKENNNIDRNSSFSQSLIKSLKDQYYN